MSTKVKSAATQPAAETETATVQPVALVTSPVAAPTRRFKTAIVSDSRRAVSNGLTPQQANAQFQAIIRDVLIPLMVATLVNNPKSAYNIINPFRVLENQGPMRFKTLEEDGSVTEQEVPFSTLREYAGKLYGGAEAIRQHLTADMAVAGSSPFESDQDDGEAF